MGSAFSDGLASTLSSIAGIKLPTGGFVVLGGAMAAAAASAVQLAAALAPSVGIIAALPSGIGVLAAGMTTLSVATAGVGDAFEAAATGSAAEFSAAMEGLSGPVQDAAQAIRDMMPALEELRNSVQAAFFEDFDAVLNSLAETLLGPVTTGMVSVAESINGIVTGLAAVATSAEGVDFVNQSFAIMANFLAQLQESLALLFGSLLSIGTEVNKAFGKDAGAGLADLITQFATFLEQAAASGAAVQWINDALAVFQQIGEILSPIVGIFGSIGAAAQTTGGNILGVFGTALQVFDDFLASAAGQETLVALFDALNQVGAAFGTVLANIAPALPPIIEGIASILGVVAPLLGPLSELVGSVLTALAPILSVIASAIQPIIGPLTTIIELLGGILVEAITAVMPLIEVLAELLGGALGVALEVIGAVLQAVAPIFTVLFEALAPIIEALTPLIEIFGVIAEIVGSVLAPIIQVLGDILLWVVDNIIVPILVPAIEMLADILSIVLTAAIQFLVDKFEAAWEGLGILFEWLRGIFEKKMDQIRLVFEVLKIALKAGADFIKNRVFVPIQNTVEAAKAVIGVLIDSMRTKWDGFVSFIKGIPGKISGALSSMFSPLWEGFRSAINSVIGGWNNLSFSLPSVDIPGVGTVGGATLNTPNIPYLAGGGLLTGPTLNVAGEAGMEAVLPLENNRVMGMIASAITRAGVSNQGNTTGNGTVTATGMSGDNYFVVKIGEREITDIIVEKQNEMNQDQLRRARAGTGRRL
jgi:phage-related protein